MTRAVQPGAVQRGVVQRGAVQPGAVQRGFSLIELMVAVVVVSILVAIAVPSYTAQVRKSRRTEAKTTLLDIAGREERFYATHNAAYSAVAADVGYAAQGSTTPLTNFQVGSGYYQVTAVVNNALTPPAYAITATPVPTSTQAQDLGCASFTVDNTGFQSATGADAGNCWK